MLKKCLDCIHFKTREYKSLEDVRHIVSSRKLELELEKSKKLGRVARYWRCALGENKTEVYVMQKYLKSLYACKKYEG